MMDSAFRLLSSLPPEANAITRLWQGLGMKASDAMRSQALIHLKKNIATLANACIADSATRL